MRYIDNTRLTMPSGWFARAAAATAAVANGAHPDDHRAVWKELKDNLASLFFDKCWYCEMKVARSDNAVDHYRPKGRVHEALKPHEGYRWLAFTSSNFRYSCTFCNSYRKDLVGGTTGGKADKFPLLDEGNRVYTQGPTGDEGPLLLDPCEIGDWRLLGCKKEDGRPCPGSDDPYKRKRAEASIDIYHLEHEPTCKVRHTAAVNLLNDIDDGKRIYADLASNPIQEQSFKNTLARILRAIKESSEFSGEMRFLLGGERDLNHPWIQELLET